MDLHTIQSDVSRGTITQCKVEHVGDHYTLSLFSVNEGKWEELTRARRGIRHFKTANSALLFATDCGFNKVTLLEPDPTPRTDLKPNLDSEPWFPAG
jgi:hypothetical protein